MRIWLREEQSEDVIIASYGPGLGGVPGLPQRFPVEVPDELVGRIDSTWKAFADLQSELRELLKKAQAA